MADDIAAIKSRLDIVEVVRPYVPSLKKAGRNFTACCPFHEERTPSFMVNPDLQIFKCFGCGESGDVISFLQKIERLDFRETLQMAAEKAGYQLSSSGQVDKAQQAELKQLAELNKMATEFWHYVLLKHPVGKAGLDYAKERGIREEELKKFFIGYAPNGDNLVKFMRSKGIADKAILQSGLAVERNGRLVDKFRQRLILPILNVKGQIVGFSGRIIVKNDMAPKYLNSPETPLYKKSEILMGLFQAKEAARKANFLILEEGNLDLLASHKAGVENIVAVGGTAITIQQMKLVKRYADSVYFCFDTDSAGTKALVNALELAEEVGLEHKVVDLGDYKDPDELIQADAKLWQTKIAKPINSVEYLLKLYSKDVDLATADGKSLLTKRFLPILRSLRDPIQQQHFLGELAVQVNTTIDVLQPLLQTDEHQLPLSKVTSEPKQEDQPVSSAEPANPKEVYLLALLCDHSDVASLDIAVEMFLDKDIRQIYQTLLASKEVNFSSLAETLTPRGNQILQDALITSVPVAELESEIAKVYQQLHANYLRRKLLALRLGISQSPDDSDLLDELQRITAELAKLKM